VNNNNVTDAGGFSKYNALQLELRRRLSKGFSANVNYQYAFEGGSQFDGFSFGRAWSDIPVTGLPTVRHAIKYQADWTLPFGRGERFAGDIGHLANALVGGWSVTAVGRIQTTVQDLGNVRLVGMSVKDLQKMYKFTRIGNPSTGIDEVWMLPDDVVLNTRRAFSTSNTTLDGYSTSLGGAPQGRYIAPANSATCIQIKAGDCAPRSVLLLSPWFNRLDFGVAKRINTGGSTNVEVRFDLLNLLDNANYNPVANPGSGRDDLPHDVGLHRREQYLRSRRANRTVDVQIELVDRNGQLIAEMLPRVPAAIVVALAVLASERPDRVFARQSQVASERPSGPTVDFVALDADGSPIADLQSSEVEIRVGDRVRVVRALRRISAAPASTTNGTSHVPPPYGTNDDVAAGRRFVVVIDQESFAAGRESLFRNAIDGLLTQFSAADRAMVAALPFGGVVVPFTSDAARIRLAAGRVAGQGSRSETGSDLACRTRRFLESLEGMLKQQGRQSSPQTLILFTAGLAAPRRDAPMGLQPGMCELPVDLFRHVASAASAARANLYVMQPVDVGMRASLPRPTPGGVGDIGSDNPLEGIEHIAGVTGGTRLSLDATGTGALLRVAKESSAYYVAELEPVSGEVFGRSRPLGVKSHAAAWRFARARRSRSPTRQAQRWRVPL
jgi:hypothetical protein